MVPVVHLADLAVEGPGRRRGGYRERSGLDPGYAESCFGR